MFTLTHQDIRHGFGALAAVAIIGIAGLAFEYGHAGNLPDGSVEVGEMQPFNLEQFAAVTLPGIVVSADRLPAVG